MELEIKRVPDTGFCFGVRRAITILEKIAREQGRVDTLGALVHNEQVVRQLSEQGINVIGTPEEIKNRIVAISAHGVEPKVEADLRNKNVTVIDTTCPDVKRAQKVAQKLAEEGYFVVVFGEAKHSEVKGILGWARDQGLAALDASQLSALERLPHKLGILSQTTQIPENFSKFVKQVIDLALVTGTEIRVIDTICHGVGKRQSESLELAKNVDLMLVIGSNTSANSKRLLELCSTATEAHLILEAREISPDWLRGKRKIGVTSGTSTSEQSIHDIIEYLKKVNFEGIP
jgi:4-hydroxy-3-methylbut-2-en-1-yl diphosphate reductase